MDCPDFYGSLTLSPRFAIGFELETSRLTLNTLTNSPYLEFDEQREMFFLHIQNRIRHYTNLSDSYLNLPRIQLTISYLPHSSNPEIDHPISLFFNLLVPIYIIIHSTPPIHRTYTEVCPNPFLFPIPTFNRALSKCKLRPFFTL